MPGSTAKAASTAVISDTAAPRLITPGIISITVENLPEKSSVLATVLVREPRLREPRLCEGAAIK